MDDRQGGLPSAVISIANAQANSGHEVSLVSTTGPTDTHQGLVALDPRVRVQLFGRGRLTGRFHGSTGLRRWVRQHLDDFDAVNVHSIWTIPTYLTALRTVARGRRLLISPHGSLDPFDVRKHAGAKKLLGPIFVRPVLTRAHVVHCTAEREARDLVTYGARIRPVIATLPIRTPHDGSGSGNGPEPVLGKDIRSRLDLPPGTTLLLFLGRVDYKKGLTYLLRALALLPEPRPALLIAGRGTEDYEALIRDLVAELDLTREVIFGGWLAGSDKVAAFAGADLFVLLSDNENYGISAMEAAQAGLPAVLTEDVYIASELVEAGAAVLSTRDPADAAAVIGGLLANPGHRSRMRAAARRYTESMATQEEVARRYSDMLSPGR